MKSLLLIVCIAAIAAALGTASAEPTYAERLGWPEGSRVVIFHCDDAGMSHSSNEGAKEAFANGVLTSVSTMMPCPWVPEWNAYLKEHPETDNGLHLTLTSEWEHYRWGPVAGVLAVPGLADDQGCLWDNVPLVVEHASADEIETEIRAQIAKAEKMGMPITHLDSHMGTLFATPEYFERYVKVGIEKQYPVMMIDGHMTHASRENAEAVESLKAAGLAKVVWEAGLPVIDDVQTDAYGWKEFKEKRAKIIEVLRELKPGITEIIVHCTRPSEVFPFITTSSQTRLADLRIMLDAKVKKVIKEEGILLTTWRELKERRDKVNASGG